MNVVILNNRQVKLLKSVLQAQEGITLQGAAEKCGIKSCAKTNRTDFARIQEFSEGFQVSLTLNRGRVHISASEEAVRRLAQATVALYRGESVVYTEDRVAYIVLDCLVKKPIPSLDLWSERFNVSRPCIQRDMKRVKRWLANEHLELASYPGRGYCLESSEYLIRKAIVTWILEQFGSGAIAVISQKDSDFYQAALWQQLFGDVELGQLVHIFEELDSRVDLNVQHTRYNMLVLYAAVTIHRRATLCVITPDDLPPERELVCSVLILRLSALLEQKMGLRLPAEELAALQQYYQELSAAQPEKSGESRRLAAVGQSIMEEFAGAVELMLGLPLISDRQTCDELSSLLTEILRDRNFHISNLNNLEIAGFAATYPAEFALGQQLISLVRQSLDIELPISRAVEVSVFIAARMERMVSNRRKKNIMLVSSGSADLSLLLYWQLTNRLGYFLDHIEMGSYQTVISKPLPEDLDLVVSTIDLPNLGEKAITIPKILTEEDILRLRRRLLGDVRPEKNSASGCALHTTAFYDDQSRTAQELFCRIGGVLEDQGYVLPGYSKKLEEHEQTFGSGIEMPIPVAVPHTEASYTKTPALAVVVTRYAIPIRLIGSHRVLPVNLALFPLLEPENSEMGMAFYSVISKLRNKKLAVNLRSCKSSEEILQFISRNL